MRKSSEMDDVKEFFWDSAKAEESHEYLAPVVLKILRSIAEQRKKELHVLDIGCGNGAFSNLLAQEGYQVVAFDNSRSGIEIARANYPDVKFFQHDVAQPLPKEFHGKFDVAISLEVIEHLFKPRLLLDRMKESLKKDGCIVISTPYHGYLKNLFLALLNKFDDHWHPLRDFGHIKFFSRKTLACLLEDSGFDVQEFYRVGRIPPLAKSMIMVACICKEK